MNTFRLSTAALALVPVLALGAAATSAQAEDFVPKSKGMIVVNTRVTNVNPDVNDAIKTAAGADTGLKVDVKDDTKPTLGFTYFFTDNIAVEAILGTTQHSIYAKGPGTNVLVHKTWVLPPVVTAQYHFNPKGKISPYVGAGVNAMIFYNGKDKNGFKVDVDNDLGYALQAGVDVALKGRWTLNADVKKVFFETNAKINDGALKSKVNLDPWVVSVGVGYRF